jgi:hypothetical protein
MSPYTDPLHGRHRKTPSHGLWTPATMLLQSANKFAEHIALGIEETKVALTKAKDEYAMYYNCRCEPAPVFTPGDRVWLDGSDIATNRPSTKLSHRHLGPFVIEACVGHGTYHLALPPHFRCLHPVFPVVKLSPALPDPIPGQRPALPPPPTLVDNEEEYEVEAILDSRMCYNRLEYLVKWKGYDESYNQWEVHTQVYAKPKIAQFHCKYPGAARHINVAIFDSIPFTRADLETSWRSLRVVTPCFEVGGNVRGHPSISLPPLPSPTPPLFICIPPPHLCTISRDHT